MCSGAWNHSSLTGAAAPPYPASRRLPSPLLSMAATAAATAISRPFLAARGSGRGEGGVASGRGEGGRGGVGEGVFEVRPAAASGPRSSASGRGASLLAPLQRSGVRSRGEREAGRGASGAASPLPASAPLASIPPSGGASPYGAIAGVPRPSRIRMLGAGEREARRSAKREGLPLQRPAALKSGVLPPRRYNGLFTLARKEDRDPTGRRQRLIRLSPLLLSGLGIRPLASPILLFSPPCLLVESLEFPYPNPTARLSELGIF